MATIINNPPANNNDSSGPLTMIIVLVVLLILGYLGWVYGLPALRQSGGSGGTQINVPDKVDVNIQQTK